MKPKEITRPMNIRDTWKKRPLIISGPCSAETKEQTIQTAIRLAQTGQTDVFRAGIWKPRTKPGMFEGVGSEGLNWLTEVKKQTRLPVAVEIGNTRQLEAALQHDIDIVWIGARTTVNPFNVQEIADALKGVQVPVFIKNPVNPDLGLWEGALERISGSGIEQIGLIHRGFSSYGNTKYRNAPMWHIAIEMKRRYPDLLFINDPSHICGRRDTLQEVAQKSADLGFDGLMVEAHIDPDKAWSDAAQQVTPENLRILLDKIIWRNDNMPSREVHTALEMLRQEMDELDDELIQLLSHRMKITDKIGAYKKEHNLTILQTKRWNDIIERCTKNGTKAGLSAAFIKLYIDAVHLESVNRQKKVMDNEDQA